MDMNIIIQYTKSYLKCQEAGKCDSRRKSLNSKSHRSDRDYGI